jgi:hypothetical protein
MKASQQLSTFLLFVISISTYGQDTLRLDSSFTTKPWEANVGILATATSGNQIPFWMRSNQFGSVPLEGLSTSLIANLQRSYQKGSNKKLVDWGMALDLRLNAGENFEVIPIQAYVKARLGAFQIKAGRSKDISGLVDSTLSTGSFALSGNALGIPKIELSIPNFFDLPFLKRLIAIKGSFSHGWMGKVPIQYEKFNGSSVPTYFHNASFHVRFGKPSWRLKLYTGINHEVQWGSDKKIFKDQYNLTTAQAFFHVITGKKYVRDGLMRDISKIGNHLGAVDTGLEYATANVTMLVYRQFFYEKGALGYLANAKDGLTGISLVNKNTSNNKWIWRRFLVEFFYSKNQAGERDSKKTPSGPEYYYNHGVYQEGYSYKGVGLGNPLITSRVYARKNLPNDPINYFVNNRVLAYNVGTEGSILSWIYLVKLTYSQNYGEYRTSDVPYWLTGGRHERNPIYGLFKKVDQFSGIVEINRHLKNNLFLGATLAIDNGELLYNSVGGSLRLVKRW